MKRRHVIQPLVVLFALALIVGCSGSQEEPGPAETVEGVAHRLADGEPVAIWQALPASYQADVTGLVHEFASKMERNLWNKTFAVVAKLTRVLKEKRHLILQHPLVAQQVAKSGSTDIDGDWDRFVELINLFATSELADLDELAKLDIEKFLSGTGKRVTLQIAAISSLAPEGKADDLITAAAMLRSLTATVVSEEGDRATLRIDSPGEDAQTEEFVRVESKWIPVALAENWSPEMASARESLAQMSSEEMKQNEEMVLMQLSMMENVLDMLLAADTPEQFNAAVGAAMGAVMGAAMNAAMTQGVETSSSGSSSGSHSISFSETTTSSNADPGLAAPPASIGPGFTDSSGPSMGTTRNTEPLGNELIREATPSAQSSRWQKILLGDANQYVGGNLRVVAVDGLDVVAKLTDAHGDILTFEQKLSSGSMSFKLQKQEIESLHSPLR